MRAENKPGLSKYFADTAELADLRRLMGLGLFSGITTNPSILAREAKGKDPKKYVGELANIFPTLPISVQILKGEFRDLVRSAIEIAEIAPNVVVKIPAFCDLKGAAGTEDGKALRLIAELGGKGIKKNVTALMSAEQAIVYIMTAEKTGEQVEYVSLFFNRIKDGQGDPQNEIANTREFIEKYGLTTEIIVGSIRAKEDVRQAQIAGAHIVTIPPGVFWSKILAHAQSQKFIDEAQSQYEKAFGSR